MDKQKRWQFYLILAVFLLTLYNILPTVFYYAKPLSAPIDGPRAENVSEQIVSRVNGLEEDSQAWLTSFAKLLGLKPESIQLQTDHPGIFEVKFNNAQDASFFRRFLPKAGALIPFTPAQLSLYGNSWNDRGNTVLVARQVDVKLDPQDISKLFHYAPKMQDGSVSADYRQLVYDRAANVALAFTGPSRSALQLQAIVRNPSDTSLDDIVVSIAKDIVDATSAFSAMPETLQRWYASFSQTAGTDKQGIIQKFIARMETQSSRLEARRQALIQSQEDRIQQGQLANVSDEQAAILFDKQKQLLQNAISIVRANIGAFQAGVQPYTYPELVATLQKGSNGDRIEQTLDFNGHHPFFKALKIDWNEDKLIPVLYESLEHARTQNQTSEEQVYVQEKINQYLINDIARVASLSDEAIEQVGDQFAVQLNTLPGMTGFLALDLGGLAQKQAQQIANQLQTLWIREPASDLSAEVYPVYDYETFRKLHKEEQKLGLLTYAPAQYQEAPPQGLRHDSVYVIARGLGRILAKHEQTANAPESQAVMKELTQLNALMQKNGYIGYPGSSFGIDPQFANDYIFERNDYYSPLLRATREDFHVKGSKKYAVLQFSDVEQRILTLNTIDDRIQEDLVKWKEEYQSAQVDLDATKKYEVPRPTKNIYWENFKTSFVKYFRGDDRKVLKWGLDLSGGKTVRIGLRDHGNRPVTNPEDLKQAVNELYTRINKMGVSERTIRLESDNIILEFPGSQGLSARDLVKASAMSFHIVNEKFNRYNAGLWETVNHFLQDVWNEAVVTNRKDAESINEIAYRHLGGEALTNQEIRPTSEYAKILYDNGLRLSNPKSDEMTPVFDDTLSAIAVMRGEDFTEWENQSHPLMVVFNNYALEGSSLNNIQVGYDPAQGNLLTFGVKSYYEGSSGREGGNPRDDFYSWTSQFAEDKILGTPKEVYTRGNGWRMAVILNGRVISTPSLRAALRDGATITGRFSQREVNQLAADLKAGSLSFVPKILSEQNVSPELGSEERTRGIIASIVALALVFAVMVYVYRFGGFIASCALLFNILIMWGVLQNLGAALTLPGIAGIVLTIGMAVDANVLVFERVREEFRASGRIGSAIQAGYRKAFSAIVDSNVTTIIAALILIQFDSGPVKGFAVTIIIGIISSMFTALFMTRYFFAGWVQNPNHKSLNMRPILQDTNIDFLGQTKKAVVISVIVMLLGSALFISQWKTIFGMDFTGGYSLNVELAEKGQTQNYRLAAIDALLDRGATTNDFQVRELSRPSQLRIQLATGMEEKGHPFYQMPEELEGNFTYPYQANPRINWVVDTLQAAGLQIPPEELGSLEKNWTVMSGQFSDVMRNNALMGLAIALLSILIYITIRFEFKYAVGAVVGLIHDVIISLGVVAFFHWLGMPVQIDLQAVGAIMTVIGYSLNDTIIIFDRIREDIHVLRKWKFHDIVNHALNVTLSRTIMTSGSTLLVLLTLVLLGGPSIFGFSLVMTVGVVIGTLSSLYIAAPIMLYFHDKEEKEKERELAIRRS